MENKEKPQSILNDPEFLRLTHYFVLKPQEREKFLIQDQRDKVLQDARAWLEKNYEDGILLSPQQLDIINSIGDQKIWDDLCFEIDRASKQR